MLRTALGANLFDSMATPQIHRATPSPKALEATCADLGLPRSRAPIWSPYRMPGSWLLDYFKIFDAETVLRPVKPLVEEAKKQHIARQGVRSGRKRTAQNTGTLSDTNLWWSGQIQPKFQQTRCDC
ncbi:hypothetical protein B0H14DRAFT_3147442 [Mycena olivaceomarginata]|nr:hypothetical protein B0H14DRAFT_3147442 [Mycena olivaceomarginata]